jgi:hypothetical protein
MRFPFRTGKKLEPARHYCRHANIVVPPVVVVLRPVKQVLLMVLLITSRQVLCLPPSSSVYAESTATLERQVNDQHGAILPTVEITVVSRAFAVRRVDDRRLLQFIPRANFVDSSGAPRFGGSIVAPIGESCHVSKRRV